MSSCVSTNSPPRHAPLRIYDGVQRVLVAEYGRKDTDPDGRVTLQARSLKIDFPDPDEPSGENSFSVDAVPAVPWKEHWGIPNRDRKEWDTEERRWIKTNPVKFAADTDALATATWSPAIGDRNAYRPVVRLLRQVRHVHLGDLRPGGLYVEVAAYDVWQDRLVTGESWAELLASTLEQVAARFAECAEDGLLDPSLGTPMKPVLEAGQWTASASTFSSLGSQAREALDAERCRAAKIWREILGNNDRGEVLPLPDGCDAAGFPLGAITAVDAVGSDQPRGFARRAPQRGPRRQLIR